MHLVATGSQAATQAGGHRFVINLLSRNSAEVEVRSCEVIGAKHRNRFTFPHKVSIDDVFLPGLSDGINQCFDALSGTTEVVSLPTLSIELPGLTLAKAHVMTTRNEEGHLAVILRFKMVLGSVSHAFKPELGMEDPLPDHTSHMSALVLTDIVMPLLDLCSVVEAGGVRRSEEFNIFMDTLIERSRDVRFQAELIKRFVANSKTVEKSEGPRVAGPPPIELVSRK